MVKIKTVKVFKFKKFPKSVIHNNEEYTFGVGGSKSIEVQIERSDGEPLVYVFNNSLSKSNS